MDKWTIEAMFQRIALLRIYVNAKQWNVGKIKTLMTLFFLHWFK
jgi:hypothetical protein